MVPPQPASAQMWPCSRTVAPSASQAPPCQGGILHCGEWQAEFMEIIHPPQLGRAVSFLWNLQGELGHRTFLPYWPDL